MRELHLHRDLGEFLDQILADERRVPACAAGGDDDAVNVAQFGGAHVQTAELRGRALEIEPSA